MTKRSGTRQERRSSTPNSTLPQFDAPQGNGFQPGPDNALVQAATQAQAQSQIQDQPRAQSRAQAGLNRAQAQAQAQARQAQSHSQVMVDHNDMQLDPSLLLAAANDPSLMGRGMQGQFSEQQYVDQQYAAQAAQSAFAPSTSSIAVYFRLHPASDVQSHVRLWVATLSSISVDELRQLAVVRHPHTLAIRIEGVMKQANGHEATISIDQDEELEAYLGGVGGVKPIFSVQLVNAWKTN